MKEYRLRMIERLIKQRNMLLCMIDLFKNSESYYGRLNFYDEYGTSDLTLSQKVILVLEEQLKKEEDYLGEILNNKA